MWVGSSAGTLAAGFAGLLLFSAACGQRSGSQSMISDGGSGAPEAGTSGTTPRGGVGGAHAASAPLGTGGASKVEAGAGGATATGGAAAGAKGDAGAGGALEAECQTDLECTGAHPVDLCKGSWTCLGGACVLDGTSAVDCSDVASEECHDVACVPATGACQQVAATDYRACGQGFCSAGTCGFGTGSCEPSTSCQGCTVCSDEAGACVAQAGYCRIGNLCHLDGDLERKGGCSICDSDAPGEWSSLPAGSECTNDDPCYVKFLCDDASGCIGDVPAAPVTPGLVRPISGTRSGSPWAAPERATLRPRFVWAGAAGDPACLPVTFDLQVDDSCVDTASCDFSSPEIDAVGLTASSYLPTTDLPVSPTPPVGARYYWRVRACRAQSCSPWTWINYVDVGRAPHDYNGDGYTDVAVGSYWAGRAAVFYGSTDGISTTSLPVASDRWVTQGSTGDINGDGFSDLVLFSWHDELQPHGRLNAYFGAASGLPAQPDWQIPRMASEPQHFFIGSDYDADGYADLIVRRDGIEFLADSYAGSALGLPASRSAYFANPTYGTTHAMRRILSGDFNADALPDLIFDANPIASTFVYLSDFGLPDTPSDVITGLSNATDQSPNTAVGDTNGDFRDDVAIGMVRSKNHELGVLYLYQAASGGFPASPSLTLPDTTHPAADNYGTDVTGGQLVGRDGRWDVVVTAPHASPASTLYVYETLALQSASPIELHNPGGGVRYWFGHPMSVPGDINGDGDDDLVVCDSEHEPSARALVFYGPIDAQSAPSIVEGDCDFLH